MIRIIFSILFIHTLTKGEKLMIAMFFAQRVILEKTSFDEVPPGLKAGVAEVLIESNLAELVPEEYR